MRNPITLLLRPAMALFLVSTPLLATPEMLLVDPMEAVYPDVRPPGLPSNAPLAAPLGGTMVLQVVLRGAPEKLQVDRMELVEGSTPVAAQWYAWILCRSSRIPAWTMAPRSAMEGGTPM